MTEDPVDPAPPPETPGKPAHKPPTTYTRQRIGLTSIDPTSPYRIMMEKAEKEILLGALAHAGQEISTAADELGISRVMFYRRLHALGLPTRRRGKTKRRSPIEV